MKSAFQRFLSYAPISHTNAHAVRGRPTLNDVERFRNGPVHELTSLKASQMCKVHTISHEITNEPYVSSNFENTGKTVTADLTTNCDAEMNTSLAEKIKNVREYNFEDGANDSELEEDTDISNLNSKVKYLSLVKFPHSPILLLNKSVFPMAMYCICHCLLCSRTECIMQYGAVRKF